MNQHFYNGFIKRAQQYGLTAVEADGLIKAANGITRGGLGNTTGTQPVNPGLSSPAIKPSTPTAQPAPDRLAAAKAEWRAHVGAAQPLTVRNQPGANIPMPDNSTFIAPEGTTAMNSPFGNVAMPNTTIAAQSQATAQAQAARNQSINRVNSTIHAMQPSQRPNIPINTPNRRPFNPSPSLLRTSSLQMRRH
jgi:hypothetical protein